MEKLRPGLPTPGSTKDEEELVLKQYQYRLWETDEVHENDNGSFTGTETLRDASQKQKNIWESESLFLEQNFGMSTLELYD